MAIIQLQLRQGTEAERATITPLEGEIIYTTDSQSLYVGDGVATGGNTPRVPTPASGIAENSTYPANTKFVHDLMASITGVSTNGFAVKAAPNTFSEVNTFQKYPVVTAATLPLTEDSDKVATTAWVQDLIGDIDLPSLADFASKSKANTFTSTNDFTVSPTVPNPSSNDNSNKVATTKFVKDAIKSLGSTSTVVVLPGTSTTINYSDGTVNLPDGTLVDVTAGSKVLPSDGTHYLVVNSAGTVSLSSSFPTGTDVATLATIYTNGGTITNISTTGLDLSPYARLDGAKFTGTLEAVTPPADDDSDKVATTKWVRDTLESSGSGLTKAEVLKMIEDFLTAPTDPTGFPMVYRTVGLHINVTDGVVPKPTGGQCNISTLASDIAVDANTTTYVWVRYADCSVVVTSTLPATSDGKLLATVVANATTITSLSIPDEVRGDNFITKHFRALYSGELVYIP